MTDQSAQEPTMEEILASIRRIISEDDAPAADASDSSAPTSSATTSAMEPEPAPSMIRDEPEDVLELTDRYQEPTASAFAQAAAPLPEPRPATQPVAHSGDLDIFDRDPEPPKAQPAPRAPVVESGDDDLVGASAASAAASSFGALAARAPMPAEGRSIEDVVREMLRPMLRDWLDAHLPAIVEQRVQAEVERISRLNAR